MVGFIPKFITNDVTLYETHDSKHVSTSTFRCITNFPQRILRLTCWQLRDKHSAWARGVKNPVSFSKPAVYRNLSCGVIRIPVERRVHYKQHVMQNIFLGLKSS